MTYAFRPEPLQNWDSYCYFPGLIPALLCDQIMECAQSYPEHAGEVVTATDHAHRPSLRSCRLRWMAFDSATEFLYKAAADVMRKANAARWRFDLHGFENAMQYTEYNESGHHHDWHMDLGAGEYSTRKLSFVLQLSDPADYIGGDFDVLRDTPSTEQRSAMRQRGSVIIFPSYITHRVSSLEQGCRRSLVAWMTGTPFR